MKKRKILTFLLSLTIAAVSIPFGTQTIFAKSTRQNGDGPVSTIYKDASQPIEVRVKDLIDQMTLEEKVGQTIQLGLNNSNQSHVSSYYVGSILSGGGHVPGSQDGGNTAAGWKNVYTRLQNAALSTPLAIPIIYEIDAVHGDGNVTGVTIFPHNIGLGAGNNPELVEEVGRVTGEEMRAFYHYGNFAPCIPTAKNVRWGRTHEGFGDSYEINGDLGTAYTVGLQGGIPGDHTALNTDEGNPNQFDYLSSGWHAVATMKHFFGEGITVNGENMGDAVIPELPTDRTELKNMDIADLRNNPTIAQLLEPYEKMVKAGARSLMPSFSSINGTKMHEQKAMLDLIKLPREEGGLGFTGFVVSDFCAQNVVSGDTRKMRNANMFNAGVDLAMVVEGNECTAADGWYQTMIANVKDGTVSMERLDEAVTRILRVKFEMGLFENPIPDVSEAFSKVRNSDHLNVARQAVRESLVLLKNDNDVVGRLKNMDNIMVAGRFANDIGYQCGSWTVSWQGGSQPNYDNIKGKTFLDALRDVKSDGNISFNATGARNNGDKADYDVVILCIGETPYAEGNGDAKIASPTSRGTLQLDYPDWQALQNVKANYPDTPIVALTFFGRPMVISNVIDDFDGLIAAWWPGSEGAGITDVLFGDYDFVGKTPYPWAWYTEWVGDYSKPFMFESGYGLKKGQTGQPLVKPKRQGYPIPLTNIESVRINNNTAVYGKGGNMSSTTLVTPSGTSGDSRAFFGDVYVEYQVDVKDAGTYTVNINTSRTSSGEIQLSVDGSNPVSYSIPNSSDGNTSRDIELSEGLHLLRFNFPAGSGNAATTIKRITIVPEGGSDEYYTPIMSNVATRVMAVDYSEVTGGIVKDQCEDEGGGQNIGYLMPGNTATYNIRVEETGDYDLTFRYAAGGEPYGILRVLVDNEVVIERVQFSSTGGWQSWRTSGSYKIPLLAGRHSFKIEIVGAGCNLNWYEFKKHLAMEFGGAEALVAEYNANLTVSADAADGCIAKLVKGNAVAASGTFQNGTAKIAVAGSNITVPGAYEVIIYDAVNKILGRKNLDVVPNEEEIWKVKIEGSSNSAIARFHLPIDIGSPKFDIEVDGVSIPGASDSELASDGKSFIIKGTQIEYLKGKKLTIRGIRFPGIFPSYVFDFHVDVE